MRQYKNKIKLFLAAAGLVLMFFQAAAFAVPAFAAGGPQNYICQPQPVSGANGATGNATNINLASCLNNIYLFSLSIGGFIAVVMFVLSGYLYMTGTTASVAQAKKFMTSTIIGLLILFGAYAFLNTLNPSLTNINAIVLSDNSISCTNTGTTSTNCLINSNVYNNPNAFPTGTGPVTINPNGGPGPSPVGGSTGVQNGGYNSGTGTVGPNACSVVPSGVASVAALQPFFGDNAAIMSAIAMKESGGNASLSSQTDICTGDGSPVSFGLFQINISANPINGLNCPAAFSSAFTGSNKNCSVTNQALYNQCKAAALTPALNIAAAQQLSNYGTVLTPWLNVKNACGF